MEDAEQRKMDEDWQKEREKEFKRAIDVDHNGSATKEELKVRVTMATVKRNII